MSLSNERPWSAGDGSRRSAPYVRIQVRVGWEDCDPAGIVFYPRFFEWMNNAAHALAREMGITRDDMLAGGQGFPLVSAGAEYLASARLEDALEVRVRVTHVGRTSFGLTFDVVRLEGDAGQTLLARGREERVYVGRDPETWVLAARPLTEQMRAVLTRYLEPAWPGG
jgi:4-hydroxybenzoyl-CoA thioesterase